MNELEVVEDVKIENMIYEIRGKQVMLGSDLAKIYNVETKELNRQVKRNIEKFPDDFCFQLTKPEYYEILRCQNGTLELKQGKYSKYLPYVFTEHGISMLASVLHSEIAVKMSVKIIRTFVAMRHYISNNLIEQKIINNIVLDNQEQIKEIKNDVKLLQKTFEKFEEKRKDNEIYVAGKIYDAYSKIVDILSLAKKELIIIDGYADRSVLDTISNIKIPVTLIVKNKSLLTNLDITKYNSQYNNLKIVYDDTFHDRYFILDNTIFYHCGASINHAGEKTFSINL